MTTAALGIRGRLEVGETLTAWAITSETSYSWQWQGWNGTSWVNVGPANSQNYTVLASQVGWSFRIVATAGAQTFTSLESAVVTLDTKKDTAPTLAPDNSALLFGANENVTYYNLFSRAAFGDADKGNYAGGTLLVTNTNSLSHGGDGQDLLFFQYASGAGQFSLSSITRDISYSTNGSTWVVIGRIDAALNGGWGNDLKVVFNSNATAAIVGSLVQKIGLQNNDDSPEHFRMLTAIVTDPTGRSAQYAIGAEISGLPDAPVFTSATTFLAAENQTAVGTMAAFDPDRETNQPQGIQFSLVSGTGGTDNALFQVNGTTGALSFVAPPDYEGGHGPLYSVRVRATDSEGSITEQVVQVQVTDVNEAPIAPPHLVSTDENGPPITGGVAAFDPEGQPLTYTWNTAGVVGTLTTNGQSFTFDPGNAFDYLTAYSTSTQTFTFTATDPGGLSTTQNVQVMVWGRNDPATISGTLSATVTEDSGPLSVGGNVTVSDPDTGEGKLYFMPSGGGSLGIGMFRIFDNSWTYSVDNMSLQFLGAGQSLDNTYTIRSWDGTATQQIHVTLKGVNDAPQFGPVFALAGPVEAGNLDNGTVVPGTPVLSGATSAYDPDAGDTITWAGSANGTFGQFTISSTTGQWTYTLDNSRAATNALRENQFVNESFTITVTDNHGASSQTSIGWLVRGTNDSPVVGANSVSTGTVVEPGHTGSVTYDLAGTYESEHFVVLQSGGDFMLLGKVGDGAGSHTALIHHNADGSRDTAYGSNGVAVLGGIVAPSGIALDAQGRTLVAGYTAENYSQTQVDWAIERHNADGTPDATFGTNGRVVIDLGGYDYTDNIFVDAAGRILVSGVGTVARLLADGSLDTSFGDGGIWNTLAEPGVQTDFQLAVDAQGRMLLWGVSYDEAGASTVHVLRYLDDGVLDTGFGDAGHATLAIGSGGVREIDLKTDGAGNITLAWSQYTNVLYVDPVSVARITSAGVADPGFGTGGIVHSTLNAGALSLALDAQGGALVAFSPPGWDDCDLSVVRFNTDGSRDMAFGNGGVATVDLAARDEVGTLNVAASGAILVTGNAESATTEDIEIAGFHLDGTIAHTFGAIDPGDPLASGTLFASDVDAGDSVSWSGNATGLYGSFAINAQGSWTYVLNVGAAALDDLDEGGTATETFTATVRDSYGATATQPVVITIVGAAVNV